MRHSALLENLVFKSVPNSEALYVDSRARILRFMLKPGQVIAEHNAPSSPFYVVVIKGTGVFSDGKGQRHDVKPNDLLVFDVAENHSVAAGDVDFIFVGILQSAPGARADHVGGTMASHGDH